MSGHWEDFYRRGRCGIDGDYGEQTYWEGRDGTIYYEYCVPNGVGNGLTGLPPNHTRRIWVEDECQRQSLLDKFRSLIGL